MMDDLPPRTSGSMQVDYQTYAEGEALLGWLNCMARVESPVPLDGNALLLDFVRRLRVSLASACAEVAHLKVTLTPDEGNDLAVANLVQNEREPELSHRLQEPLESGQLILNLRAEADPESLQAQVIGVVAATARDHRLEMTLEDLESFRPGKPVPTHRMEQV